MRWSKVLVTVLGGGLIGGCQLLVTFESVPEGAGGSSGSAGSAGTTTSGGTGGASTGGTTTSGGTGGTTCTAECCSPLDCPVPAEPCQQGVCAEGLCGVEPVPEGGDASTQIPGDCRKSVCQGGVVVRVEDPSDPLDDGNDCTADVCDGIEPKANSVQNGTVCILTGGGAAGVCDGDGKCVECLSDAHCPADEPECDNEGRVCVPQSCANGDEDGTETGVDCGGPSCGPCKLGQACVQDTDCSTGACTFNFCGISTCMDGVQNGSEPDTDCGDACPKECGPGQKCDKGGDCEGGQCTGQGGVCVPNCKDKVKNGIETDVDCGGGECLPCYGGQACGGVDAYCHSGDCGPAGTCEPGANGTKCTTGAHCLSGDCVDGVCCSGPCTGTCKTCNFPGSAGTCSNIPAGQDPEGECAGTETCNGSGSCAP